MKHTFMHKWCLIDFTFKCAYFTSKQTHVKPYLRDGRLFVPSSKAGNETTVTYML